MSHEIRTPMNGIIGMLSLAKSHIQDKGAVEEYIGRIENLSQFLLRLINDILDMSRIESKKEKDEQYYISQIEKLIEISGVTGEYVKSMELYAILSVKYTEIEQDEYERIILLFEKFRFGGKTLRDYELYVLECFKNKFIKLLYKKSKIHKKLILRYKYLL